MVLGTPSTRPRVRPGSQRGSDLVRACASAASGAAGQVAGDVGLQPLDVRQHGLLRDVDGDSVRWR